MKRFKQSGTKLLCICGVQIGTLEATWSCRAYAHLGCRKMCLKQHKSQRAALQTVQTKRREMRAMNSSKIVILCKSPGLYQHMKYYNGNMSSWRELYRADCHNVTFCLNAERRMTDSCSRRKMSFCKLKFNNVNIILSLT